MADPVSILGVLKVGYGFGNIGFKIIQKIRKTIKKNDPIYKEIDNLYDIISGMKDSINTAKDKYFDLIVEKREVEEQLEEFKKWKKNKQHFRKVMVSPGAQIVTSWAEMDLLNDKYPTWYCPGCYERKKLGVMQFCEAKPPSYIYQCTICNSKMVITKEVHEKRYHKDADY